MTPAGPGALETLGIIAGGGDLPLAVARRCLAAGRPFFVVRLTGFADAHLLEFPGAEAGIAELGRILSLLRANDCRAVCFVGRVARPDFSALKPDFRGLRSLPGVVRAATRGDDALLRHLLDEFEREGFRIEGADVAGVATLASGAMTACAPQPRHEADIRLGLTAARRLGELDIGQGVVACRGVILAVEAQEGTDAMLQRCLTLPPALRGRSDDRWGVLVKWPKPTQDRRVDLPTLGVRTVEGAAAAGLAGVVSEAGGALVVDPEGVRRTADRLGLFVVGLEAL